jgi:hypothetical protein
MMHFPTQWILLTIATFMLYLEPLIAGAATSSHKTAPSSQLSATSVMSRENPMAIAQKSRRKSRAGRSSSAAQVEQFLNVHRVGMSAVRGCVTDGLARDCERLVNSKSSLNNWCLQGKSEACSLFLTLSNQEAYQNTSDALLRSVQ